MLQPGQLEDRFVHLFFPLCAVGHTQSNFTVERVNPAFSQISNIELNDIVGKRLLDDHVMQIFQDHQEIIRVSLKNAENEQKPVNLVLHTFDDSESPGKGHASWLLEIGPINDADHPGSLLLTFHKIEDQEKLGSYNSVESSNPREKSDQNQTRALKNKVQSKQRQYQAAADELNNFVYSVSHDLRAPLRRIDGFSQELIQSHADQLDEAGTHYLKRIRQGAQDMGTLIDELLKLSRISRQQVQRETVDAAALARTVFEELIELEEHDRKAILKGPDANLQIDADPGLVKVVLTNLISNALKFSSKNKDTIIKLGETTVKGQPYVYIKDNGVGFDPDHSDKLFRAFSRLHSQRDFTGSGIGLATVKRIISLHGGDIFAESTPNQGATFYFNFHEIKK